ncbi:MAG: oxygenase MpaB family protein [Pseudomonadota bacterium]|nr:oxygenase MpaB family protein [Pseudomonadota bacterium]
MKPRSWNGDLDNALSSAIAFGLDRPAREFLHGEGPRVDFTAPAGEAALLAPDSVSWRVFKNPVSLFIGGVAAVLLEFAEPKVRSGVWDHSTFRTDPVGRLKRTGLAAMVTVYGPESVARKMIAGVVRAHERIEGTTPSGETYRANDPELLDWVQATAAFGFLEAYSAYARRLSEEERNRYYAEGGKAASLYGATGAPQSIAELEALFAAMEPRFEPSPIIFEFIDIMRKAPALPGPLQLAQRVFVRAAVDLLPASARRALGLTRRYGLRPFEGRVVRRLGRRADRVILKSSPAVQACLRMGLPEDYLFRRS